MDRPTHQLDDPCVRVADLVAQIDAMIDGRRSQGAGNLDHLARLRLNSQVATLQEIRRMISGTGAPLDPRTYPPAGTGLGATDRRAGVATFADPPDPPRSPPSYLYGQACGECWEWFDDSGWPDGWISRWLHRRRWGHQPWAFQDRGMTHDDMVRAAAEYRARRGQG